MNYNIIDRFLSLLEIKHTHAFTTRLFNEHPHKYDMFGLRKMLAVYGIQTIGIEQKGKRLDALTYPCILHIHGDFVIGCKFENKQLTYLWKDIPTIQDEETFRHSWTGHALVVDNMQKAQEPDYTLHAKNEWQTQSLEIGLWVIPAIFVVFGLIRQNHNIHTGISLILCLLGIWVCFLLMQKQLFKESKYGDRVCSLLHQGDCNNILFSEKAKIWGMSWSEIGLGYFIGYSLLLSSFPYMNDSLIAINWIAMSYGIWSIWYQSRIARQWCMLCLIVQLLIWTNGIMSSFFYSGISNWIDLPLCGLSILLSILCVHFITQSYYRKQEKEETVQKLRAFKCNPNTFKSILKSKGHHPVSDNDSSILMGNPKASMRITILTNPHCNPCARMHEQVENLLQTTNNEIAIQYIFSAFTEELKQSNRFLIAAMQQKDIVTTYEIYHKWYVEGKYRAKQFYTEWGLNLSTPDIEKEMKKHEIWQASNGFHATPTILVNGYELPAEYELKDLAMLTDIEC
jgi:glutaredoxin/uncharacterized membrane protein